MEDPRLYRTNVRAVKQSLAARPQAQAFLDALAQSLHTLKKLHYTDALRDFDENQTRFEQGTIGLGDYVKTVARVDGREAEKRAEEFPNVARFLACRTESALDVAAVEKTTGAVTGRENFSAHHCENFPFRPGITSGPLRAKRHSTGGLSGS